MTSDWQAAARVHAGRAGYDGLCSVCGYTYKGMQPVACPHCGMLGTCLDITKRSQRQSLAWPEPAPEEFFAAVVTQLAKRIVSYARSVEQGGGDKDHLQHVGRKLRDLVSGETAEVIIMARNMYALYQQNEYLKEALLDAIAAKED